MTTATAERKPGSKYTEEDIQHGLVALAQCHGSSRLAARMLEEQGRPIPGATLQRWKDDTHSKRFVQVEKEVSEQIWQQTSRHWRRVIEDAAQGTAEAIEATRTAITSDDPKAATAWSSTSKNLATAGGIATDKAAGIDGRPMHHHETRDLPSILRQLERFPGVLRVNRDAVDSTATDVTEVPSLAAPSTPRGAQASEQTGTSSAA